MIGKRKKRGQFLRLFVFNRAWMWTRMQGKRWQLHLNMWFTNSDHSVRFRYFDATSIPFWLLLKIFPQILFIKFQLRSFSSYLQGKRNPIEVMGRDCKKCTSKRAILRRPKTVRKKYKLSTSLSSPLCVFDRVFVTIFSCVGFGVSFDSVMRIFRDENPIIYFRFFVGMFKNSFQHIFWSKVFL